MSREQLKREAEAFATQSGLKDKEKEIFRGALVAQHVSNIDQLEDITPDERFWLRSEVTHPYKLPRPLLFTIILCALGAAVQGSVILSRPRSLQLTREAQVGSRRHQWRLSVLARRAWPGRQVRWIRLAHRSGQCSSLYADRFLIPPPHLMSTRRLWLVSLASYVQISC